MTYILIYDVEKAADFKFKAHYRLYDESKNLVVEDDYTYFMRKKRVMTPAVLKSRIMASIWLTLHNKKYVDMRKDRYTSSCLVSNEILKMEIDSMFKGKKEEDILNNFVKKVDVDDNPRIYRVVLINDNYTIIKAENKYLTREQAKEELFNKQLEEA